MTSSKNISLRIKELIKEAGFTQKSFSKEMGWKPKELKKFINYDDSMFMVNDLINICKPLNITLKDFFDSPLFLPSEPELPSFASNVQKLIHVHNIDDRYDVISFDNAYEIIKNKSEYDDLIYVLNNFTLTVTDVTSKGGNKSNIPKKFEDLFVSREWQKEHKITGNLEFTEQSSGVPKSKRVLPHYLDGYSVDYYKNAIAVDVEWNSKDQTYDRDLVAMRAYYEAGIIQMGVIITRGYGLDEYLNDELGLNKFQASSTKIEKLIWRLTARRSGGCPILTIGIKSGFLSGGK